MFFVRCEVVSKTSQARRRAWIPQFRAKLWSTVEIEEQDGTLNGKVTSWEIVSMDNFLLPGKFLAYLKPFEGV